VVVVLKTQILLLKVLLLKVLLLATASQAFVAARQLQQMCSSKSLPRNCIKNTPRSA
jgi:hypothetical protein